MKESWQQRRGRKIAGNIAGVKKSVEAASTIQKFRVESKHTKIEDYTPILTIQLGSAVSSPGFHARGHDHEGFSRDAVNRDGRLQSAINSYRRCLLGLSL